MLIRCESSEIELLVGFNGNLSITTKATENDIGIRQNKTLNEFDNQRLKNIKFDFVSMIKRSWPNKLLAGILKGFDSNSLVSERNSNQRRWFIYQKSKQSNFDVCCCIQATF